MVSIGSGKSASSISIQNIEVGVDIEHSYIGDLVVRVLPPADTQSGPILLHDRQGGGSRNLKTRYDPVNAPALPTMSSAT